MAMQDDDDDVPVGAIEINLVHGVRDADREFVFAGLRNLDETVPQPRCEYGLLQCPGHEIIGRLCEQCRSSLREAISNSSGQRGRCGSRCECGSQTYDGRTCPRLCKLGPFHDGLHRCRRHRLDESSSDEDIDFATPALENAPACADPGWQELSALSEEFRQHLANFRTRRVAEEQKLKELRGEGMAEAEAQAILREHYEAAEPAPEPTAVT